MHSGLRFTEIRKAKDSSGRVVENKFRRMLAPARNLGSAEQSCSRLYLYSVKHLPPPEGVFLFIPFLWYPRSIILHRGTPAFS